MAMVYLLVGGVVFCVSRVVVASPSFVALRRGPGMVVPSRNVVGPLVVKSCVLH
jgi:hypothetical protein